MPTSDPMMKIQIEFAESPEQYAIGQKLFSDYVDFLGLDLEFQGFSEEMAALGQMYGPPKGCLLLARKDDRYIGAVGLRELDPGVAEMKRMFVVPECQRSGAGRALMEAFLARARQLGYRLVRLDSLRSLDNALALYRKFGFVEIEPYRFNPFPDAVFMERCVSD